MFYSGFKSKQLELDYNKTLGRMLALLIDQVTNQIQMSRNINDPTQCYKKKIKELIVNCRFFQQKFTFLLSTIKELELSKLSAPKLSGFIVPFETFIRDFQNGQRQTTQSQRAKSFHLRDIKKESQQIQGSLSRDTTLNEIKLHTDSRTNYSRFTQVGPQIQSPMFNHMRTVSFGKCKEVRDNPLILQTPRSALQSRNNYIGELWGQFSENNNKQTDNSNIKRQESIPSPVKVDMGETFIQPFNLEEHQRQMQII